MLRPCLFIQILQRRENFLGYYAANPIRRDARPWTYPSHESQRSRLNEKYVTTEVKQR